MGVHHVCPSNSRVLPNPGLLAVRTLGLSRLRSARAIQLVPQTWRACLAPILPAQAEELHAAVGQ
eukprot:7604581-Alexandrium_andersonii.AAC.1